MSSEYQRHTKLRDLWPLFTCSTVPPCVTGAGEESECCRPG